MFTIGQEVVVVDKTQSISTPGSLVDLLELTNFAGVRPDNGVVGNVVDKTYHPTLTGRIVYAVEALGMVTEDIVQEIEGVPTITGTQEVERLLQYLVGDTGLAVSTQFHVDVRILVTASDADQAIAKVVPLVETKFTVVEYQTEEVPVV